MNYSIDNYEELFLINPVDTSEEMIESLRDKDIKKYRIKTIKSGDMLECEIYPLWKSSKRKRALKIKETSRAQKNLNDKNTKKNIIRLMNTNFTKEDMWATFTYDADHLPEDENQAKKDMQNYIRRLKRIVKKESLEDLKYIYVTEYEFDPEKGKKRVHHHIVMNFRNRDLAEEIWDKGGRTHARRLQPDDYGLEGMARYITKDPKNSKRYTTSRNLKKPTITVADSKMTKRRAEKIAVNENAAPEIFEKWYQGYQFNDIEVKLSEFISGTYLYVRMRKSKIEKRKNKGGRL
ncbi:MAG: hypothetical protein JXR88_12485 [Clostridia bacterium]|nr:hypothetical protein [Clostridia bacterium]